MPIHDAITYLSGDDDHFDQQMLDMSNRISDALGLDDFLNNVVGNFDLRLTPSTFLMLLLPLSELTRENQTSQLDEARNSIRRILHEMTDNPSAYDREHREMFDSPIARRSCTSLIWGWWRRFCNIPPFCRGPEEDQE